MKMKFEVTEEDINRGIPRDCCYCPIARALTRELFDGERLFVHVSIANIIVGGVYAYPPVEAIRFMQDFDQGREVKPFSFELDLIARTLNC